MFARILTRWQLPHDDPAGGITFKSVTRLNNPRCRFPAYAAVQRPLTRPFRKINNSPFQVALGTAVFNLTYQDVFLGQGIALNTQIVGPAPHPPAVPPHRLAGQIPGNNYIEFNGRLVPHNGSASELNAVSDLFTRYLNGVSSPVIAQGVSTIQADGSEISWLSAGLTKLQLNVPFQAPGAVNAINSIDIGYLNLTFTPDLAWQPGTTSNAVHATIREFYRPYGTRQAEARA